MNSLSEDVEKSPVINALSIDVEEYFHANNLAKVAPPRSWNSLASRVHDSTMRILSLLDVHNIKATFFILGYVARRHPALVKEIAQKGHEIASHGYGHRLVYNQSPRQFRRDVTVAKAVLEDLIGEPICGYRAPSFSIARAFPWAYDILIESGHKYDSSLYPVKHPRYGNSSLHLTPFLLERECGTLAVYPLSVTCLNFAGKSCRLPTAGGGYWRLLPAFYTHWALRRVEQTEGRSLICYFHPWEFDSRQPVFKELGWLTRIRHYRGLDTFESRVDSILAKHRFGRISDLPVSSLPKSTSL